MTPVRAYFQNIFDTCRTIAVGMRITLKYCFQPTVTVNYPNGSNAAGKRVTVTVSYPYDPIVPYFSTILNKTMGSTSEGIITF